MARSVYDDLLFQISQTISMLVGLLLFAIGLSGYFGLSLQPIEEISFLTQPMGLGPQIDQLYWIALALVGMWLIIFYWARLAAILAIGLIVFKWAVLNNSVSFGTSSRHAFANPGVLITPLT